MDQVFNCTFCGFVSNEPLPTIAECPSCGDVVSNGDVNEKQYPVCRYCKSDNVAVDAVARWNKESNDWILSGTFDSGSCEDCEQEQKYFNWVNFNEGNSNSMPTNEEQARLLRREEDSDV